MNSGQLPRLFLLPLALGILIPSAQAQPVRTWVASSGLDINPCTRAAPCRNFDAAISAVAANGEVVALDSAGYGPVNVTKSVSIIAPKGIHAAIAPTAGAAVAVNAGASDVVVIRGLYLNAQGGMHGIRFISGGKLTADSIVTNGFSHNGLRFEADGQLFVRDSVFRNNTNEAGVFVTGPFLGIARAVLSRCRFHNNGTASGGVSASFNSRVTVVDSVASGNRRGFEVLGSDAELNLERCVSSHNVVGLFAANTGTVRASNCTVTNNTLYGIEVQGMSHVLTRGNNTVEGNAAAETFSGTFSAK